MIKMIVIEGSKFEKERCGTRRNVEVKRVKETKDC